MPAIMMIEAVGDIVNVIGSSSDIVATGPMPGNTPISVPTKTPTKHASRFAGCRLTDSPYVSPWSKSTTRYPPQGPAGSCTLSHTLNTRYVTNAVTSEPASADTQRCRSSALKKNSSSANVAATNPSGSSTSA